MRAWMQALASTAPTTRTLPWRKHQIHSPAIVPARQDFAHHWDQQCFTALHQWGGRFSRFLWLLVGSSPLFASAVPVWPLTACLSGLPSFFCAAWLAFSGKGVWFLLYICTSVYTPNHNMSLQPRQIGPLFQTGHNFLPISFQCSSNLSHIYLHLHKPASFPPCLLTV